MRGGRFRDTLMHVGRKRADPARRQIDMQEHQFLCRGPLAGIGGHNPEEPRTEMVPLSKVAGQCRHVPAEWLGESPASPVSKAFVEYVRPLVGELVEYAVPLKDSAAAAAVMAREEGTVR